MDYRKHIEKLAANNGVRIEYRSGMKIANSFSEPDLRDDIIFPDPRDLTGRGRVVIPPWDEVDHGKLYWVALHELGHLAKKHLGPNYTMLFGGGPSAVSEMEAEAWMWGIEQNGGKIDSNGRWAIDYGMGTYIPTFGAGPKTRKLERLTRESAASVSHRRAGVESLLA